nr:MAG TPA: hypothetical protein [Caudoviricetes sp.]DAU40790.1 MAG TPA: hypothetical protein [Caudoviricetes sp.]
MLCLYHFNSYICTCLRRLFNRTFMELKENNNFR